MPLSDVQRTALVVGGTGGIGLELTRKLVETNYNVTMTARNASLGQQAAHKINSETTGTGQVTCVELDLSNLQHIREFGEQYQQASTGDPNHQGMGAPLNVLSFNAGLMNSPYHMCTNTLEGSSTQCIESQYQINHLSSMLLIHYLLPSMVAGNALEKRVMMTGSRM